VPNVAHVFRTDQHMYLLYEVYDPASTPAKGGPAPAAAAKPHGTPGQAGQAGMKVLTSIEFLQGTTKVFETPLVEATSVNVPGRDAVAFAFDIPLDRLNAGLYICQVNVIDDTGGSFSFPRQAMLVRAAAAVPPPATTTPAPGPSSDPPSSAVPAVRAPSP
jgi:hypothetical protein